MKKENIELAAMMLLGRNKLQAEYENGKWTINDPATGACWEVITDGRNIVDLKCIGEGICRE